MFIFSVLAGADLGEIVCPQHTDGVYDNRKGDHELDTRGDDLTGLKGDTANDNDRVCETLATERCKQGGDDAICQRRKETRHDVSKVERGCENDNITVVKHICLYWFPYFFLLL